MKKNPTLQKKGEIVYPESDGKPMAETDLHRDLLLQSIEVFKRYFPDSYVSGNIFLYYEKDNPRRSISPDVLLALEEKPGRKRVYKTWESAPLDLVIELTSISTKSEDYKSKKEIYSKILKVPNYIIYDPERLILDVFMLKEDHYEQLEADERNLYYLAHLNIFVAQDDKVSLRFFDPYRNPLLTQEERIKLESQKAKEEFRRAENETEQRMLAEKRIKELEALLRERDTKDDLN